MAIRILVDSGSDISYTEAKDLDVILVSMKITINEKTYLDGIDLDHKTFYHLLKTENTFPKTSLLPPQLYQDIFEEMKRNQDDIIVITISSGLSGTYQSSLIAKDTVEYDRIYIVDSLSAASGERLLTEVAVKMRREGCSAIEIFNHLEEIKLRMGAFAMVNTLEYLHKGGRLSRTQAIVGDLINIKPILTFKSDGTLTIAEKAIGKTRAMKAIIKMVDRNPIDRNYPVYYLYAVHDEATVKLLEEINKKYDYHFPSYVLELGPTIGAHIGPGVLGLIYVKTKN